MPRYFRKRNSTAINEKSDNLEYHSPKLKTPCLLLFLVLIAFHTSYSLKTQENMGAEKTSQFYT